MKAFGKTTESFECKTSAKKFETEKREYFNSTIMKEKRVTIEAGNKISNTQHQKKGTDEAPKYLQKYGIDDFQKKLKEVRIVRHLICLLYFFFD